MTLKTVSIIAILSALGTVTNATASGGGSNQIVNNGSGGVYMVTDGDSLTVSDNSIFQNNSVTGETTGNGAAIANNGTVTIGDNILFDTNIAEANGGAIFNNGKAGAIMNIGNGVTFTKNQASWDGGGAIFNNSSGVLTILNDANFTSNWADGNGGAINTNADGVVSIGSNANFTLNSATGNGGAIFNVSKFDIGTNAIFDKNSISYGGGAIYQMNGIFNIGTGASFTENSAKTGGAIQTRLNAAAISIGANAKFTSNRATTNGGAIYNSATTNIAGNTTFSGNSAGSNGGAIYNDSTGLINLDTAAGNITFTNNTAPNAGDIYNLGSINITGASRVTSDKSIVNNGTINKTGGGELYMSGTQSGTGIFKQTAGTTTSLNNFFKTIATQSYVQNSTLNVTGNVYDYGITYHTNSVLNHKSRTNTVSTINSANTVLAPGAGNVSLNFDRAATLTANAKYDLMSRIETGGANNFVNFGNSDVFLGATDYRGTTKYTFDSSALSISGPGMSVRDITFDKLETHNSSLSFDLYADPNMGAPQFTSDTFSATSYIGDDLKLGTIRILGVNTDAGITDVEHIANILLGGMHFIEDDIANIFTTTYEYEAWVDEDRTGLYLDAIGEADEHSLNAVNQMALPTRAFNFSFFEDEAEVYAIGESLDNMAAGNFTVRGFDHDASHSVISGSDTNSLFKITNATNFALADLTVQQTTGAISMNNSSAHANIKNVIFKGNNISGSGGAVAVSAGVMDFYGDMEFSGNTATTTGGAIYSNGGEINFNVTQDDTITFSNNMSQYGGNDIAFGEGGGIISFEGADANIVITGGIESASTSGGKINMNNTGTMTFANGSINNNYRADFYANNGRTIVESDNWIGGTSHITNDAWMLFKQSDIITGGMELLSGGNLDLRGTGGITVGNFSGDNSGNIWLSTDGATSDVLHIAQDMTGGAIINMSIINGGNAATGADILVVDTSAISAGGEVVGPSIAPLDEPIASDGFTLAGDTIDIAQYTYQLGEQENGWYLQKIAGAASAVTVIPALHLSIVKSSMNELRKRLGALRNNNSNEALTGAWVRGYGKYMRVHENLSADMNLFGIEGGIDFMTNAMNGKVYLGLMGGLVSSQDIDVVNSIGVKSNGNTITPSVGAYLTWVHKSGSSNKWFVDLTARHFWVHTELNRNDGTNGYDVRRGFWAFSGEIGKLFYMRAPEFLNIGTLQNSHISIEPKMELRYGFGAASDFQTENGIDGHVHKTTAFRVQAGVQANFLPNGTQSKWKPYVELAVSEDFAGKTDMQFGETRYTASDTSGTGFEASVGVNAEVSENTYAYGAATVELDDIYTSYMLNLGIRTKF